MTNQDDYELVAAVEPTVERLMQEHRDRRQHWYAHEYVPWEQGRSYVAEPWQESDASLSPEVRTSLVLNLLTEDNLPYYHAEIAAHMPEGSAMARWTNLWTAEEGQHSIALRSYLLTSRNCDPKSLEDDRLATMEHGHHTGRNDLPALFVYTSAQELATRVSHRNAGVLADDEVAYKIMARIAADENHHYLFYRGVAAALIEEDPSTMIEAIHRVFTNFSMPGTSIPGFVRRAVEMAKAGVYNLRVHHDRVLVPLIRDWGVEHLTGLSSKAKELQDKVMELPAQVLRKAEIFERRMGMASA
ncbi:MAG TPA: acyl-ACP desaturase [Acidimicrobiia bacterium]|nr:acyl-ACP desaturase [Acidimicrobiia bacterium]